MLMSVDIGRDNWTNGQLKANVFVCSTHLNPIDEEFHLWMSGTPKAKPGAPAIQKLGSPNTISAGINVKEEMCGKWTTQVYDLPPGTLLKLNFTKSMNGNQRSANILLHVREGAPLQRLNIDTTSHVKASKNRLVYEGRYDILTPEQAASYGYTVPAMFAPTYRQERWRSYPFIRVEQLAPETISQTVVRDKKVVNSSGEVVNVPVAHTKRALDL